MANWSDIHWFHAVIEHGSFSAAARELGTTQATISRRVKALEAELGSALFIRGREGTTLTPLGEGLRGPAMEMAQAGRSWDRAVIGARSTRRQIIVTCGELIGGYLSKYLGQLQKGLGSVDIELRPTNAMVNVSSGEADLALRNKRPESGQLKARRLHSDKYGMFSVFGAKTFFSDREINSLDALRGYAWIAHSRANAQLQSARWITENIGEEQIRFRMNSTALVLDATRHNEALALLPRFIGRQEQHLAEVFGPVDGLAFEMWIVRRDEGYPDPVMERLIKNIAAVFK
ncbi:LysR family transcriptional regulator [Sphingorhabdus sp. Alg231-15]|uniref:LysR family transcriptional regulator n=1 Tax=Sphingorhabdus sp. Alg231-15 TaxID=1922222 RepID=UPI000D55EF66